MHVINRWKFNVGGPFALTIISIISASLCVLCSLSCFYNYRIHHGQGPPFTACSFCPECLFPSVEQNQQPVSFTPDDSDPHIRVSESDTPAPPGTIQNAKLFGHFEVEAEPQDGAAKKPHDRYAVPDLNFSGIDDK